MWSQVNTYLFNAETLSERLTKKVKARLEHLNEDMIADIQQVVICILHAISQRNGEITSVLLSDFEICLTYFLSK